MSPDSYFFIAKLLKITIIGLSVIAAVLFFIGCVYMPIKEARKRKRKFTELYSRREPLDDHEFYEKFFQPRGVPEGIVVKIRGILADELYLLDMSRIVPDDDFTGNLAFVWEDWGGLDGLIAVEVVERFEREFGIAVTNAEAASMKTIDDIVLIISEKVKHRDTKIPRSA